MSNQTLYIVDFDGVICDSALETGIAGWKAALQIWDDMPATESYPFSNAFRQVRPILETGYEAILIIRLLFLGETPENILNDFETKKSIVMTSTQRDENALKQLFNATRDQWIQERPAEWLRLNPLFPSVLEKLTALSARGLWMVLTTKQERFVAEILKAHGVMLPAEHIYGLDRKLSKEAVLVDLIATHLTSTLIFVEDRLPALLAVKNNTQLQNVSLQLADWGYNLPQDRLEAARLGITVINLEAFLTE